jgi:hypothetical protein
MPGLSQALLNRFQLPDSFPQNDHQNLGPHRGGDLPMAFGPTALRDQSPHSLAGKFREVPLHRIDVPANAAANSSSVPKPHWYNCTIAKQRHPSSPDRQLRYGWRFTNTRVIPTPSTTLIDFSGCHPGKLTSSIARELFEGISYHETARRKTHQGFV